MKVKNSIKMGRCANVQNVEYFLGVMKIKKILVVGDAMRDSYYDVEEKINPENQSPAYLVKSIKQYPGGAANVVNCLRKLDPVCVIDFSTGNTEKIRLIKDGKYLCRIDKDVVESAYYQYYTQVLNEIAGEDIEYIIVSDYNKGVLTKEFCANLEKTGKKLILDVKPQHLDWFEKPFLIKPNKKELIEMTGCTNYLDGARKLALDKQCCVLATLGELGMILCYPNGADIEIPAEKTELVDVTGAGDTVISVLVFMLNSGKNIIDAATFANKAATISVSKLGCYCPTIKEITHE